MQTENGDGNKGKNKNIWKTRTKHGIVHVHIIIIIVTDSVARSLYIVHCTCSQQHSAYVRLNPLEIGTFKTFK